MDPENFATQFNVSRETLTRLLAYQALLGRWQQRINLVGPATLDDFWARHAADSAQILALAGTRRVWLDLGSGGGFPGHGPPGHDPFGGFPGPMPPGFIGGDFDRMPGGGFPGGGMGGGFPGGGFGGFGR